MTGNTLYDVVTMKMKCNWKYNWTVSFVETKKISKIGKKLGYNPTCLHSDSFKIYTVKS